MPGTVADVNMQWLQVRHIFGNTWQRGKQGSDVLMAIPKVVPPSLSEA